MTDTAANATGTTQTVAATAAKKPVTTLEGMTSYRSFDSTADASAYLEACTKDFADFTEQNFAMVAVGDDGFDPAVYTDSMRVRVAVVRNVPRQVGGKREPTTIKAIAVAPVPTLDSLLADDAGRQWVQKIIDKELNHVAVRPLRDAENLETAIAQMPRTREAFITSSRDAGGILDTFNDLYKTINDALAGKLTVWSRAKLVKAELKKSLESTAYAREYYPQLEDRGEGKDSLFVTALKLGQQLAAKDGKDPAIFDKWLATRDAQVLSATQTEEEDDDIDVDALMGSLATPTPAAEPDPATA